MAERPTGDDRNSEGRAETLSGLVCWEEEERGAVFNERSKECAGYCQTNRYTQVRFWSVSVSGALGYKKSLSRSESWKS